MDRIIVALDVNTVAEARRLVGALRGTVGAFKIGSRFFTSEGPAFVKELVAQGDRVFLDLKFHDIPHTVAGAVGAAARMGVWMVNVHASGGLAMMQAARLAADEESASVGLAPPLVIGVTVLTSIDQSMLAETGVPDSPAGQVERLAALAQAAALDGVVASPQEIASVRAHCGERFTIVTPGIRSGADEKGDQSRIASASAALAAGADYLVIGRPIIAAADPRVAAERIVQECRAAANR